MNWVLVHVTYNRTFNLNAKLNHLQISDQEDCLASVSNGVKQCCLLFFLKGL